MRSSESVVQRSGTSSFGLHPLILEGPNAYLENIKNFITTTT